MLDAPTNIAWIDPSAGPISESLRGVVEYVTEAEIEEIYCENARIAGVAAQRNGARQVWRGDYYISAVPIERFVPLINARMMSVDPVLANIQALAPNVEWMNGLQFFLKRDLPMTHGHVIHMDTAWALTQHLAGSVLARLLARGL